MKPIGQRVLIKEIQQETETKSISGIIIPISAKEKEYDVLITGDRCKALRFGDKIRLHEHAEKTPYEDMFFIDEKFGIKVIL